MKNIVPMAAWADVRPANLHITPHAHDYYELVVYKDCLGNGLLDGKAFSFGADSFSIVPPYLVHEEYHLTDGQVMCVGFTTEGAIQTGFFIDTTHTVSRLAGEIVREVAEQKNNFKEMVSFKLGEVLVIASRLASKNDYVSVKDFQYAAEYIKGNCHEKISLSALADRMNLSYDYFRHRFKEQLGISPQRCLLLARLDKSVGLLRDTDMSCTEIAWSCGFSDSSQFSMLFRKEYGMTPRAYREHYK